jgi:5-methylcytosine-specific restriction endonuclease McrA
MKNLKEDILRLRADGFSYSEISKTLNCSKGSISYYLGNNQKEKAKSRRRTYRKTIHGVLAIKMGMFKTKYDKGIRQKKSQEQRIHIILNRKRFKFMETQTEDFTLEQLIEKIGHSPICYLTGEKIDLSNPSSFHFDHIVPTSKGGKNTLDNLGVCTAKANFSKRDMSLEEYIDLCKSVLMHNGYAFK